MKNGARWVILHDGPEAETELLADLLLAIRVRSRVVLFPRPVPPGAVESRLLVQLADYQMAQAWLERAFREVWQEERSRQARTGRAISPRSLARAH